MLGCIFFPKNYDSKFLESPFGDFGSDHKKRAEFQRTKFQTKNFDYFIDCEQFHLPLIEHLYPLRVAKNHARLRQKYDLRKYSLSYEHDA